MAKQYDPGKEELERLYRLHTYREIADLHGVHEETVRRALKRYGIATRSYKTGPARVFDPARDELESLYQQYSMKQIARMYHVGETAVWKRLKEHGIKLRGYEEGGHRKKPGREFSREHRKALSAAHTGRWEGDKNPNWRGGVHVEHLRIRASGRYKQWRLDALALRGDKCQGCGVADRTVCKCCGTKIRLHVHHVLSFAKDPQRRFDPSNSEVLCPACHRCRHFGKTG